MCAVLSIILSCNMEKAFTQTETESSLIIGIGIPFTLFTVNYQIHSPTQIIKFR